MVILVTQFTRAAGLSRNHLFSRVTKIEGGVLRWSKESNDFGPVAYRSKESILRTFEKRFNNFRLEVLYE